MIPALRRGLQGRPSSSRLALHQLYGDFGPASAVLRPPVLGTVPCVPSLIVCVARWVVLGPVLALQAATLLIHSPGDNWVQSAQAVTLHAALRRPAGGRGSNEIDVSGECVSGQHPDVLNGASAKTLAGCIVSKLIKVADPQRFRGGVHN